MKMENEIWKISERAINDLVPKDPNPQASIIQMSEDGPIYDTTALKPQSTSLSASLPLQHSQPSLSNHKKRHYFCTCNDPYCTTCSSTYVSKPSQHLLSRVSDRLYKVMFDVDKGYMKWILFLVTRLPVVSHHSPLAKWWARIFPVLLLMSISVDPLFFFLLSFFPAGNCGVIKWKSAANLIILRSIMDFIYLLNIIFQSRLSYIDPESTVTGAGESVVDPLKVAIHYFRGKLILDFFIMLPIPQLWITVISRYMPSSNSYKAKNFLLMAVLCQFIPKLWRFLPLIAGKTPIKFINESGWAPFVINLLSFMLAGHVVGSFWYLFGLQRIKKCLEQTCDTSPLLKTSCESLIFKCEVLHNKTLNEVWRNYPNASTCFQEAGFSYGIYEKVLNISPNSTRYREKYLYSLFWGFQQISTLAGNQVPSNFVWEILFTMSIIGLGLLLFALLIGNMQNFLLSFGQRKLEMVQRNRDLKLWMKRRCFPRDLKTKVKEAELHNWATTYGIDEQMLIENLSEDLQRDIRRHLFKFLNEMKYFDSMDDNTVDAIRERLKPRMYLRETIVLDHGDRIENVVFILRGEMESHEADGSLLALSKGDVCGNELLIWFLDQSSATVTEDGTKTRTASMDIFSSRRVICKSNVEAFTLSAADLRDVHDTCQVNHSAITAAETSGKKDR